MLELTPDELLTTTRTVRRRLDFDRPVPRELLVECIDVALQAPTGGLKQNWHWIAIGDPEVRKQVAEVYREAWNSDKDHGALHPRVPGDQRRDRIGKVLESGEYLAQNLERVPWLVVVAGTGRPPVNASVPDQSRFWGSMLPAMWSFMLAARARGLGSAWTSAHLKREEDVAKILGLPYPDVTQCGLFPVAFSVGTDFKRAQRVPAAEVIHWDRW
jgi:nitroreductase